MEAKKSRVSSSRRMMNCSCSDIKPAFEERNIPVALSTDDNYLPYVKVLINSIAANTQSGNLDILILNDGITRKKEKEFLKDVQWQDRVSIRFLNIGKFVKQTVLTKFEQKRYLSAACCYRLFLPDVLVAYDKIIYLDVDTLVCRDLGDLYAVDLGDNLLGAAIDIVNSSSKPEYAEWARGYGFVEWGKYVNTGVLLLNLAAFRKMSLLDKLLPIAVEASKWFCDQDALNFLCKGRIQILDPRWNVQVGDYCLKQQMAITKDEAYIYHFTGSRKPWCNPEHMMAHHWWRYVGDDGTTLWRRAFGIDGETTSGAKIAVSVVVPVYNAVSYLSEMLVSLSAQTLRNIEIICVDDGSTDGSAAILSKFAARDSRIKIIKQKNSGGAIARNHGIEEAKGRWLFFADADDFCRPDMLAEMVAEGETTVADVVVVGRMTINCRQFGYCYESTIPQSCLQHDQPVSCHTDGVNVFSGIGFAAWNKLYRSEFVFRNGIRFHQIPSCDDVFFVFTALIAAERITFVGKAYYYYRASLATSQMGKVDNYPTSFLVALLEVHDVVALHDVALQRQYFKASIRSCFDNLFVRRSIEGVRKTYAALSTGGLKALEFPAVDPMSVDMGRYSVVYALARQKADLSEILHAYYSPRCEMLASSNSRLQKELSAFSSKVKELRQANEVKKERIGALNDQQGQLSAKVNELRAANEAKRAKLKELEVGRKQLSAKVDELRAANEAKRAKLEELEVGRKQLSAKVDELRAANEAKRAKLGELEAGRKQLSAKVDELRAANEAKRAKLGELEAGRKQLSAKVDELRAANEAKRAKLEELEVGREQLSAKVDELRAANEAKRAKLGELEAGRKQLSAKVDELRAANEAKRAKLGELEAGREQLSAKVDELRAANEAKRTKLGELEAGRKQLSAKVDELRAANEAKRAKLGELEAGRKQLSAKVDELRAANEAKRTKLGELEARRKQLSAKVDELRAANEAKRQRIGELQECEKRYRNVLGLVQKICDD